MTILGHLVKLQEIDNALTELEDLKGDLPKRVQELSRAVEELASANAANEARLQEIELEIRRIHGLEQDRQAKIEKLQEQLYLVKTNKEYDALTSEIDHLKAEVDEQELRELELSEEQEQLQEQLKFDRLQSERMSAALGERNRELEKMVAGTEKEYQELMERRQELEPAIDSRYIALYNRVRGARHGVAVVPVLNHACGGCHSRITTQSLVEIREGNKLVPCPVCRRILYWKED